MAYGATINQVTQIGRELTPGVAVAANRRLASLGITLNREMEIGTVKPRGSKFATAHPLNREWSAGDVEGGFGFNELQYALAGIISDSTPGQLEEPAGTPVQAWEWLFSTDTFGKDEVATYTMEQVDTQRNRAVRAAYCMFNSFSIESTRADEIATSGEVVGKNLEGDVVPTANPVQQNIIVGTTGMVDVFMDDAPEDLGTTKLEQNFAYTIEYGDRFGQTWVHNTDLDSWDEHVETEPSLTVGLTVAEDTPLDEMITSLRQGQRKFIRFRVLGPEIVPGINFEFTWDFAGQINEPPSTDDTDGAYTAEVTFDAEHDGEWERATEARLVNANSAL